MKQVDKSLEESGVNVVEELALGNEFGTPSPPMRTSANMTNNLFPVTFVTEAKACNQVPNQTNTRYEVETRIA